MEALLLTPSIPNKNNAETFLRLAVETLSALDEQMYRTRSSLLALRPNDSFPLFSSHDLPIEKWWEAALRLIAAQIIAEFTGGARVKIALEDVIRAGVPDDVDGADAKASLCRYQVARARAWLEANVGNVEDAAWTQAAHLVLKECRNPTPSSLRPPYNSPAYTEPFWNAVHPHTAWTNPSLLMADGLVAVDSRFSGGNGVKDLTALTTLCRMAQSLAQEVPLSTLPPTPLFLEGILSYGGAVEAVGTHRPQVPGIQKIRIYKNCRVDVEFDPQIGRRLRERIKEALRSAAAAATF